MADQETFPARLARLREAAGLSRYAMSKRAGISPIGLTRLERGGGKVELRTAAKLARALGGTLALWDGCAWPEVAERGER